ncbi:MAG: YiiD C-terminal domain-containing protein, partial [Chloroflexi bacterium]|nr:YiiD C-terminal domain-containing protein [Chloroflexota bacterium]
ITNGCGGRPTRNRKKEKARIKLTSKIFIGAEVAASFSGVYVALDQKR